MSGAGFGSFMSGLSGGMSIGKSIKNGMQKNDVAAAAPGDTGFGVGQNVVAGDINQPQYANSDGSDTKTDSSPWGMLGGIVSSLGGSDAKIPKLPGIAGGVLGGKGIGDTIIGKLFK